MPSPVRAAQTLALAPALDAGRRDGDVANQLPRNAVARAQPVEENQAPDQVPPLRVRPAEGLVPGQYVRGNFAPVQDERGLDVGPGQDERGAAALVRTLNPLFDLLKESRPMVI